MWIKISEGDREYLSKFLGYKLPLEVSFNEIMPIVIKINSMGKGVQFAIFKTYVSCTSEVGGKFYKNFDFTHAEYIMGGQTLLEAILKLSLKFTRWYMDEKVG